MLWQAPHATGPVRGRVVVPGSKSETNRALVLAALADGPGTISGALESRDSALMIAALRALGVTISGTDVLHVIPPERFVTSGRIDCGLAGTVMRFVPPVAALADGPTTFVGDPHASARPMAPLIKGLRQLGARASASALPFTLSPPRVMGDACEIDASSSSQFISGPLLAGARYPSGLWLRHSGTRLPSRPHIDMTVAMLRARGVRIATPDPVTWVVRPGRIKAIADSIAPDLTNAAVFLAAAMVTGGEVTIAHWPLETTQPGASFLDIATRFGATVRREGDQLSLTGGRLGGIDVDLSGASELTPVVAAVALFAEGITTISGVGHIRGHETDRLAALTREFSQAGAEIQQSEDGLRIVGGGKLRPRTFETYDDHRMAHAAALVGLRVAGTTLADVGCTAKTMPRFAEDWMRLCAH